MVTPSISETVGLLKQSSCQLSAYSSASDRRASAGRLPAPFGHLADVAAGAEGPVRGRGNDGRIDLRIAPPAREAFGDSRAHGGVEGVERARPVENDEPRAAFRGDGDVAFGGV